MMDDEAVAQVLEQYHPFVRYIAKRACHSSAVLDMADLCQVGDMAVLRAVKAYDPSSGRNIKSFVTSSIRNAVFNEAARFLGVLTVDFRTTNLASLAYKLSKKGMSDSDIAVVLTDKYGRNFDADHARDLRIIYSRRNYQAIESNVTVDEIENDVTIKDLLESVVRDETDRLILNRRILGDCSIEQMAAILHISRKAFSKKETCLKNRIKRALEDAA